MLVVLALLLSNTLADLTCKRYHSITKGISQNGANVGPIHFFGIIRKTKVHHVSITATSPATLDNATANGTILHFETCTSKSLGFAPTQVSQWYDYGCHYINIDYIRIINPATGQCLTNSITPSSGTYKLVPSKCESKPTRTVQVFVAVQSVTVDENSTNNITSAGSVYFYGGVSPWKDPDGNGFKNDVIGFTTWFLGHDNKTLPGKYGYWDDDGSLTGVIINE